MKMMEIIAISLGVILVGMLGLYLFDRINLPNKIGESKVYRKTYHKPWTQMVYNPSLKIMTPMFHPARYEVELDIKWLKYYQKMNVDKSSYNRMRNGQKVTINYSEGRILGLFYLNSYSI